MEVEMGGKTYKIGRLNAFAQMYILKRAVPVLGKLQKVLDAAGDNDADLTAVLPPLGEAIGALPDESLEYVCNAALDVVDLRQEGGLCTRTWIC